MGLRYSTELNVIIHSTCFNPRPIAFSPDKKKENHKVGKHESNVFPILTKSDELTTVNTHGNFFHKTDSSDDGKQ